MPSRRSSFPLQRLGVQALWLALGLLFFAIGLQKLTGYEADAVRPYAATSPFLGWCYRLLGARGASALFAVIEIPLGLGLISGLVRPGAWPARLGAAGAAVTSFITASFLFTAPGVLVHAGRLPVLSIQVGQLFAKDLVLFAASLLLLGEAMAAQR